MATHSSILAWRIPGMGEPGGLPSMGSHRVGHDWSDVAAATAVAKSCSTLCDPMDYGPPGSSIHGMFQARILEWFAISSPGYLLDLRIGLMSPTLAGRFFATEPPHCFVSQSVQLLSRGWLFLTPWTAACQASMSITTSWSLFKLMSFEWVMPSYRLLHRSRILAPSIFPSIRVLTY